MDKSYELEIVERLTRIEACLEEAHDIKARVRRLELGFTVLACAVGGVEIVTKVILV